MLGLVTKHLHWNWSFQGGSKSLSLVLAVLTPIELAFQRGVVYSGGLSVQCDQYKPHIYEHTGSGGSAHTTPSASSSDIL